MKPLFGAIMLALPLIACAQDDLWKPELHLAVDARVDFTEQWNDGHADHDASGFKGRYFNVMADGKFNDLFSFSFRHRLNKPIKDGNFFDATDWLYLSYTPCDAVTVSAGKEVVCIGGYEYDRAPINIFWGSEFWNNIGCYQWGFSGSYSPGKNDRLTLQMVQSPFNTEMMRDIYAYNLQWNGSHGPWQTIWSVNLIEYARGRYINYIALGNRLGFGGLVAEIDFMNRASNARRFLFSDCSVMADLSYRVNPWLRPFVKYTYDVNKHMSSDYCVLPGTEINTVGAGIEAWPLLKGRNEVRVHADAGYAWGSNGNPSGTLRNKQLFVNVGLKWRFQIL